ncbi:MAG: DUF6036 family nucleotidyltransferase [Nanoarchaeota archaeon]
MIDIQEQQNLFLRIAERLPKKIEVYAIGGTAMMFLGLKYNTLDVDLVFSNVEDRKIFKETAKLLDFKESSAEIVYGKKENTPEMVVIADVRLDLFLFKIVSSYFSEPMQKRATQIHEFAGKLIIRVADPQDILIMKSVTSREKDVNDIVAIIKNTKINWDVIVNESCEQVRLGNETAILGLGEKLEKLANRKIIVVPKDVLDRLWKLLSKQVKGKNKVKKNKVKNKK